MNSNLNTNAITNTKNTSSVEQNKRQDKIVICDDDKDIVRALEIYLSNRDYELLCAYTGREALDFVKKGDVSLVLLDIMMPEMDGITALRAIREKSNVPVILITAKSEDADKVLGLDIGADDYITKPFSLMILRARIRALLRRNPIKDEPEYNDSIFLFRFETMEFYKNGIPVELSRTEQRILYLLISNPNIIITRDRLLEWVWPEGTEYVEDNALSVAIRRLRDKLEDESSKPKYIKTVYGKGYMWENL